MIELTGEHHTSECTSCKGNCDLDDEKLKLIGNLELLANGQEWQKENLEEPQTGTILFVVKYFIVEDTWCPKREY